MTSQEISHTTEKNHMCDNYENFLNMFKQLESYDLNTCV